MNAAERATVCNGGQAGRWLAPAVVSVAVHVAAAACFWPTGIDISVGDAGPTVDVQLVVVSVMAEDDLATTGTPPAAEHVAPEIATARQAAATPAPIEPEPATEAIPGQRQALEPIPVIKSSSPIVLAAAVVEQSPRPSVLDSIHPARKPAAPAPVREAEAPVATEAPPAPVVAAVATAPASTTDSPASARSATASDRVQEARATPTAAASGIAVVMDPQFRRPPSPPSYPARSVELDQQGTVVIRALIAEPGKPSQTVVWQSSGYPLLDAAATAAVSRWEFEPLRLGAIAQTAWVQVPVRFKLK